jgi:hypothetical protein
MLNSGSLTDPGTHTPVPGAAAPPAAVPAGQPPDEFAGIRAGPTRHPVLAALTVALAAFLIFQLRADLRYALSPATPVAISDARLLARAAPADVPVNRLVRLTGVPDRESAMVLDTHGSWNFTQFFRLLGCDNRVFVRRVPDPLPVALAERDVFTGRLLRFRDLSFDDSIRRHLVTHVSATHFFAAATLEQALRAAQGGLTVADRLGEPVTLLPDDELAIDTGHPGDISVQLPPDRVPDGEAARAAVVAQGGEVIALHAASAGHATHEVVARFPPARRDAALAALADLDRRVHIGAARTTTRVRIKDLQAHPAGLAARLPSGEVVLPRAEIQAIRTLAPLRLSDDAWILIEGERPRDHLRDLIVVAFLVGFAVVNLLAVRRAL